MKTNNLKKVLLILLIQLTAIIYCSAGNISIYNFTTKDSLATSRCVSENIEIIYAGYLTGYSSISEDVSLYIDFGDGTNTTIPITAYYSDGWYFSGSTTHIYSTAATGITPNITATVISDVANYSRNIEIPFNIVNSCITISGITYEDCNNNCVYDIGEEAPFYFSINDNLTYFSGITSDINGIYSRLLPPSTYNINYNSTPCNPSGNISGINTSGTYNIAQNCFIPNVFTSFYVTSSVNCTSDTVEFRYNIYADTSTIYNAGDIVNIEVNYGDGTITSFPVTLISNGYNNYYSGDLSHVYLTSGTYMPIITLTMPGGDFAVLSTRQFHINNSCDIVSGYLYEDLNNNCIKDIGEIAIINSLVHIHSSTLDNYVYTDALGFYSFRVPTGSIYTITTTPSYYFSYGYVPNCPMGGTSTFTLSGTHLEDFGYTCSPLIDASVYFWARGAVRPNEDFDGYLNYHVVSCIPVSGTVSITIPPLVTVLSTTPAPSSITGSVYSWDYSSLGISFYDQIYLNLHTSITATAADIICFDMNITPTLTDADLINNTYNICKPVFSSWDPNFKEVHPVGDGPEGIVAPGTDLTYTVHFQNMGNSFARNIFVMDTLDPDLDINTFQLVSSSHPVQVHWIEGNILKFAFNNIMLVDTSVSQDSSQGFFQYRIKHNASAPIGTNINNTASIYFDYNPAVVTNTTQTKLGYHNSIPTNKEPTNIKIYPNPANDFMMIETDVNSIGSIQIYNAIGKLMETITISSKQEKISLDKFSNGLYLLNIIDMSGKIIDTKKLNIIK